MAKKTIHLTESEIIEIISKYIENYINEGIDINFDSSPHTVGFNPNH